MRVACRYGLDATELAGAAINDVAPPPKKIACWARTCGVDPERLSRLALSRRHPVRSQAWFLSCGPPCAPTRVRSPPVCCACFAADCAVGRDEHLRADWMLAERCVCPTHRRVLLDWCPACRARLRFGFRLREGRARVICRKCEQELAAQSARGEDGALVEALILLQGRVGAILRGEAARLLRLEEAVATLWAPLDISGAARPTLALWFDERGWRCPTEVQHVIGAPFPLGRLPIAWRVVTLIALDRLFEIGRDGIGGPSSEAADLLRRAAPPPRTPQSRDDGRRRISISPPSRPFAEYLRLAREILADPQ